MLFFKKKEKHQLIILLFFLDCGDWTRLVTDRPCPSIFYSIMIGLTLYDRFTIFRAMILLWNVYMLPVIKYALIYALSVSYTYAKQSIVLQYVSSTTLTISTLSLFGNEVDEDWIVVALIFSRAWASCSWVGLLPELRWVILLDTF
jgi:hypothetical protein